jgi:hypothetical protein
MQVTLRQAHKLVDKINASFQNLQISPVENINIWQMTPLSLDDRRKKFHTKLARQLALTTVRSEIRGQLQEANQGSVNELVALRKITLDMLALKRSLHVQLAPSVNEIDNQESLEQKVEILKASKEVGHRHYDNVIVSLVNAVERQELENEIGDLQLSIDQIEDQLTTANSGKKILLSETTMVVLKKERLL